MKGGRTLIIKKVGKEKKEDEGWVYIRDTAGGEREKA